MNISLKKVAYLILAFCLFGCAAVTKKEDQIAVVVDSQIDVLKKIVSLRQQEPLKTRICSDPLLLEQENILLAGLESVIHSQETYLKAKNKPEYKRSVNER